MYLIPKHLNKIHTPNLLYTDYNIINLKMSTCFFPLTFSTVSASCHTPYISQCYASSVMLSYGYVVMKEKYYCPNFVYRESQSHCELVQQWRCTVLTVGNSHTQKAAFDCVTSVTESQHLPSPYSQPALLYIHSLTQTHITTPTTKI